MSLDLRLMRYVVAVADEGGFQAAAERLHMAQPSLSRQIRQLETQLGVALFHRRPTRLTRAGEVFVDEARRLLAGVESAVRSVSRAALGATGAVDVGFTVTTAYDELPALRQALRLHDPDLVLVAHELWDTELDAALEGGQVELAVGRGLPRRAGVTVETLRVEPYVAVVGATHRLAGRTVVHLADLRGDVFRLYPRHLAPTHFDIVTGVLASTGERFQVVENPGPSYRNAGVNEPGQFTLMARSFGRRLPDGLVALTLKDDLAPATVELLWRPALASPAAHVVVATARHLARAGAWA